MNRVSFCLLLICLLGCNPADTPMERIAQGNGLSVETMEAPQNDEPILHGLGAQVWRFRVIRPPAVDELTGGDTPVLSIERQPGVGKAQPLLREPLRADEIFITVVPTEPSLLKSPRWIVSVTQPRANLKRTLSVPAPFASLTGITGQGGRTRRLENGAWELLAEGEGGNLKATRFVVRFCVLRAGVLRLPDGREEAVEPAPISFDKPAPNASKTTSAPSSESVPPP